MGEEMKNLISTDQFSKDDLDLFVREVDGVKGAIPCNPLNNKIVATLFFEPSTRTKTSFHAAIKKLGGDYIDLDADTCSIAKGESLKHTIRTASELTDAIIMRHSQNGAVQEAAEISKVPIINAGDGDNEHPTQALLDIYTMRYWFPYWWNGGGNITVTFSGDVRHSRAAHSLIRLLRAKGGVRIFLHGLAYQDRDRDWPGCNLVENRDDVLPHTDVLYLIRPQRERWSNNTWTTFHYDSNKVCQKDLDILKGDAIIMHPLPANEELTEEAESDKRCVIWQQVQNGLLVRMTLLRRIFGWPVKTI